MDKHICILEDDPGIREILEILLSEEGYHVEGYSTVHDFFSKKNSAPDLFILDVMLPDGNGMKVCNLLKSDPATKATPIMMMSAHADLPQMTSGCKAEEFVVKPFDIHVLLRKISRQINSGPGT
ncbi:DNA-binding response OmpR family regulator [Pedobacter sp. W3I1]|uniref:response regulator transcription factor n=1 Tax=Pedobacter sp. W3I1 TaxID=3042291 RepID=UPI002785A3E7|nr:response regulator transcription factor [Pedobacter sp. W3I1]MDQ0640000.1 DNA-binding response OmpR family regulator [Pedobacter sp. W3I1]